MPDGELSVLFEDPDAGGALDRVRETTAVTHVVSPRLVIVRAQVDGELEARLRSIPGVASVAAPDAVEPLRGHALTPEEQLFVDAWTLRWRESAGKRRPGEGLPWDAEGFQPA